MVRGPLGASQTIAMSSAPSPADATARPASPDSDPTRLRPVHRAMAELRRGTAVRLEGEAGGEAPLLVAAAEGASASGLAELSALAAGPAVLLVSAVRAAALLGLPMPEGDGAVALALPGPLPDPERLRRLAEPGIAPVEEGPPGGEAGWRTVPLPALAPAALALAKLSRLLPAVVAAPAGAATGGLLPVVAEDVLRFPAAAASALARVAEASVPLEDAPEARLVAFRPPDGGVEHLALLIGRPEEREAPLVRLHSECFTGDFLGSLRCDCGPQLRQAIRRMAADGAGALLYLAQEGRGIGLVNKLRAYGLQDQGLDTLDANRALGWGADERSFLVAATMLEALGLRRVRLLTNNPDKVAALAACGIEVAGRLSHAIVANGVNDSYLATKARRFGHLLG